MEMNSNGANKLAERILDDARADAGRVLDDAKAGAQALRSEAQARMEAYSADCAARREAAAAALVDSGKTRASLDGRKAALQKKRLVIDEAFRRAYAWDGPYLIDCRIDPDEYVLPMLPPGGAVEDMIVELED